MRGKQDRSWFRIYKREENISRAGRQKSMVFVHKGWVCASGCVCLYPVSLQQWNSVPPPHNQISNCKFSVPLWGSVRYIVHCTVCSKCNARKICFWYVNTTVIVQNSANVWMEPYHPLYLYVYVHVHFTACLFDKTSWFKPRINPLPLLLVNSTVRIILLVLVDYSCKNKVVVCEIYT